jgi:hypothetical protein
MVPTGTFRLSGLVRDTSGGVPGVTVEVVSGTGAGQSARTLFNGAYTLFGVAGNVELRVSAPGYVTQDLPMTVNSHSSRDVNLVTTGTTADMSGQWTLTVSTSGSCSETWSPESRRRVVGAGITQQGTRLTIRFQDVASLVFETAGRIAANAFSMELFYDDYYLDWGLTQRVSPTEWIGVNGQFTGTVNGGVIDGTLVGVFHYYLTTANALGPGINPRSCPADPKFELRR